MLAHCTRCHHAVQRQTAADLTTPHHCGGRLVRTTWRGVWALRGPRPGDIQAGAAVQGPRPLEVVR